ncbi:MAG: OmpH/Skp family outer membrane protein [Gammaproteobacteria bacterium]
MTHDSMKHPILLWGNWVGLIFIGCIGLASLPASATPLRLGYVNIGVLLREMPQSKAAELKLNQELSTQKQRLAERLVAIKAMRHKLHNPADRLSLLKRMEDQQRLNTLQNSYRMSEEQYSEDFNLARNQALANLQRLAIRAIHAYALRHHFTLVLGNDVFFADPSVNITPSVLARLKARYEAHSGSTPQTR